MYQAQEILQAFEGSKTELSQQCPQIPHCLDGLCPDLHLRGSPQTVCLLCPDLYLRGSSLRLYVCFDLPLHLRGVPQKEVCHNLSLYLRGSPQNYISGVISLSSQSFLQDNISTEGSE